MKLLYHIKAILDDGEHENIKTFKEVYQVALGVAIPKEAEDWNIEDICTIDAWVIGKFVPESEVLKIFQESECYYGEDLKYLKIEAHIMKEKADYIVNSIRKELV